jgi:hypothetical protein
MSRKREKIELGPFVIHGKPGETREEIIWGKRGRDTGGLWRRGGSLGLVGMGIVVLIMLIVMTRMWWQHNTVDMCDYLAQGGKIEDRIPKEKLEKERPIIEENCAKRAAKETGP